MSTQFVKVSEAANVLAVSPATIRAGIERGDIPGRRVGGHYRVSLPWLRSVSEESERASEDRPQAA